MWLKNWIHFLEGLKTLWENADYQHYLLFPWCFQKASLIGSLKVGIVKEIQKLNLGLREGWTHYEKRRKYWLPAFYPFPKLFSKCLSHRVVKSRECTELAFNLVNLNFKLFTRRQILDWSKLKANAREKNVFGSVENIVEKGEDAGYQHLLLFPKCLQKAPFSRSLKVGIVW